ncbi:hypothetical protein HQ560_03330, partial [bacterium]|nr:hypothetical protein [bacterium]
DAEGATIAAADDGVIRPIGEDYTDLRVDFRFNPITGVYYYADTSVSIANDDADTGVSNFNQGLLIAVSERWQLYLSQRYEVDEETRISGQLFYKIDPKWRIMVGWSHRTGESDPVEAQLRLIRDLHDWVAEFVMEDDMEEDSQFVGIQLRPKMFNQLVGDVEYEREFSEGLDAEMSESYQQYEY